MVCRIISRKDRRRRFQNFWDYWIRTRYTLGWTICFVVWQIWFTLVIWAHWTEYIQIWSSIRNIWARRGSKPRITPIWYGYWQVWQHLVRTTCNWRIRSLRSIQWSIDRSFYSYSRELYTVCYIWWWRKYLVCRAERSEAWCSFYQQHSWTG